jgi:MSHA biogenesis protein MshJ
MVTCALFVVVFAVINTLLLSPVLARQKLISTELATDNAQIDALSQEINQLSSTPALDPDAQNRQRIAALQSNLKLLETNLSGLQTTLINPDKMPELLRSLLKKNSALKLIELKTLPVTGLLETESSTSDINDTAIKDAMIKNTGINVSETQNSPVFKHGVEITIEGSYLDLLAYVSDIEKMPWHVLWSKVALNAEHYPDTQLTLTVYTLSLDKTWLTI